MEELQGLSKEVNDEIVALGFQPIHKAVDQCYANIIAGKEGERFVFPTKWKKLNGLLLGGLQPGKMYVIAGRPGSGKSAFSNKMLFGMLEHPKNNGRLIVLYWSFEMPGYQQLSELKKQANLKTKIEDIEKGIIAQTKVKGEKSQVSDAITKQGQYKSEGNTLTELQQQLSELKKQLTMD